MKKTTSMSIVLRAHTEHTFDLNDSFSSFSTIDVNLLAKINTKVNEESWKIILPSILPMVSKTVQEYLDEFKGEEIRIIDLQLTCEPVTTIIYDAEYRAHEYDWDNYVKAEMGVDLFADGTYNPFAHCLDNSKHVLDGVDADLNAGVQLDTLNDKKLVHNFDEYNASLKIPKAINYSKWSNGCGDEAYAVENVDIKTIWDPAKIIKIDIESLNLNLKNGRVL